MIETLIIKNIATYDKTGITIEGLGKINFIYGANGCGKTTVTKFIDNQTDPLFCECSLVWKNDVPVKALVYNKDFKNRNFGKGSIDGVFTLGQATKEEIELIEKMQADLVDIKEKGLKKKDALENLTNNQQAAEDEFKEIFWTSIYKKYEDGFKEAFVGFQKKETFKTKTITEYQTNTSTLKTYDELIEKAKTIFGKVPSPLFLITEISYARITEIENDKIWRKKIIGKADVEIATLIQKLDLNDWVNEGKDYLQEDETCPFCQQKTISKNFRRQLEDYFDETFINDTNRVKDFSAEYNRLSLNLNNLLKQIQTSEKANPDSKLSIETFSAYLQTASSQFVSNQEILSHKIKEPSRVANLITVTEQLNNIQALIAEANKNIAAHNAIVANFVNERDSLISDIWRYLVEENKTQIGLFTKKMVGLHKGIDALKKQHQDLRDKYSALNKKIKEANKNVTSVQPSVDEINKLLKSYGFMNFEIVPSSTQKNQYQIQREDGSIAESTLSEGEITFITFLYFLQLSKGSVTEDSITEERVLIVDDPISSLDSSVLFVVSSLLKQIIKAVKKDVGNIKQIIVFTHNVYFHKEVSFIDGRTKENGDTKYWIIRRNKNISTIQGYELQNPIHNSYELLWRELKNIDRLSGITVQNTMRRIIENYFKILGKYGDDDLINKFDSHEEQEICRSLICWINDGSHSIPDDLFIEYPEAIMDKYTEVFRKIFEQMGHSEHYKMMMGNNSLAYA